MVKADVSLFYAVNNLAGKHPALDSFMILISKYGPVVFGLILLWLWFHKGPDEKLEGSRKTVIYAVLSALFALGINQIIGFFYFRPRPYAEHAVRLLVDRSPDPSFPSDHSTGGFSLASAIFIGDRKLGLFSLGFAALLAFSRVYVGAHFPMDVLGGAMTGIASTVVITASRKKLDPVTDFILKIWNRISPLR